MRIRGVTITLVLLALVASACGGSSSPETSADRTVADSGPEWDAGQAILRTEVIEAALDTGLERAQASCVIDTALGADFVLDDLVGIDLSADTSSTAGADLAEVLADAYIDCGPSVRAYMNADIAGSSSIPATHAEAEECLTQAYTDTWRAAYADRYRGATVVTDPGNDRIPEVANAVVGLIAGCEAGGAVILGASNEGNLETSALSTLEWTCLEARTSPDAFMSAFPFPEEPGDALERMGNSVKADVAYCEAWVGNEALPDETEPAESEPAEADAGA